MLTPGVYPATHRDDIVLCAHGSRTAHRLARADDWRTHARARRWVMSGQENPPMITLEYLRFQFPNPVSYDRYTTDERRVQHGLCCIGGALCMALGSPRRFPSTDEIVSALIEANPDFNSHDGIDAAYEFVEGIQHLNDAEHFDDAWRWMGHALAWRTGDPVPRSPRKVPVVAPEPVLADVED